MKLALFGCFHGWPQRYKQPPHGQQQEVSEAWSNLPGCKEELEALQRHAAPGLAEQRNHTVCEVSGSCPTARQLMPRTLSEVHLQACTRSSSLPAHTAGDLSSNAGSIHGISHMDIPYRLRAAPAVGKGPATPDHVTTFLQALASAAGDGLPVVTAKVVLRVSTSTNWVTNPNEYYTGCSWHAQRRPTGNRCRQLHWNQWTCHS